MSRKRKKNNLRSKPTGTQQAPSPSKLPQETSMKFGTGEILAICLGALTIIAWSYWPALRETFAAWVKEPDYSHGFLVAPLSALFLYLRRDQLSKITFRPAPAGLVVLAICLLLRYAAGKYFLQPLDRWTIPIWIMGCVWTLFGLSCLRWALPSIAFLWFMFPLPYQAESLLSVPLQSLATKLSTAFLVILGLPALAEGNTIWIGEEQLFVEDACSGLRIFVGIFALAFAFAIFARWPWWQKAFTLAAALPIAIFANVLRIVGTALLYYFVSSEAGRHFSHDLSGLVMIPVAAAFFWLFIKYLDLLLPEMETISPTMQQALNSLPEE